MSSIKLETIRKNVIILKGHIEKETDFYVTVHLPNSGMILDLKKCDLIEEPQCP